MHLLGPRLINPPPTLAQLSSVVPQTDFLVPTRFPTGLSRSGPGDLLQVSACSRSPEPISEDYQTMALRLLSYQVAFTWAPLI